MGYDSPNKKPTIEQLNYLKILGYTGKIPETRYQTTLLIADLLYHWKPREPSQKQISYLKKLGHKGPTPKTRGKASDLISNILHLKKIGINVNHIPFTIYGDKWSEGNPFEHILEHTQEFHLAKEWRDSLDN
tara:strand:- start:301 stop:696 length:396 start_codon:yes stop_codon:yes gene_type:complete